MKTYTVRVDAAGNIHWYKEGTSILHREGDLPANEYTNGDKSWYLNGKCHREIGAAIITQKGDKDFYLDGQRYSETDFNAELARRKAACNNKVVEIDGVKYKLTAV